MSSVIRYLEQLGQNGRKADAATISTLDADAAVRQALLDRDADALAARLGGRHDLKCVVFVPD